MRGGEGGEGNLDHFLKDCLTRRSESSASAVTAVAAVCCLSAESVVMSAASFAAKGLFCWVDWWHNFTPLRE